jgi:two-component system sensor histidine kinase ChvG
MTAEIGWDTAEDAEGGKVSIAPRPDASETRPDTSETRPDTEAGSKRPASRKISIKRRRRLISPLTRRLLAVNMLALAIPVGGLLYLGAYRDGLIEAELEALRTQGKVFAGAIGEGATATTLSGDQMLDIAPARNIVRRLSAPTQLRARLFLSDGELAADSRLLVGGGGVVQIQVLPPQREDTGYFDFLIDIVNWLPRRYDLPPYREAPRQNAADYEEAAAALNGEVMAMLRINPDTGAYVLSAAVPVQRYRQVLGSLMLSKDGADIDLAVGMLRLDVLKLFGGALVFTVLLSLFLAGTIARPILRLAAAAERVRRDVGRQNHPIPDLTRRHDEIGDLSGSLRAMTEELQAQLNAIERFAADVSHELKNPLTSLRSAVETAGRVRDPKKQQQLMAIVQDDVRRLDRLITDIADASRLDAELNRAQSKTIDLGGMLATLADMHHATAGDAGTPRVIVDFRPDLDLLIGGMEDRLVQVFQNLIANAVSFSPPGGDVTISASRMLDFVEIRFDDDGPGLPGGKLEAIFDRFYSERPSGEKFGTHSGLGLSISKQIVEAHGGTIHAENRMGPGGHVQGARFTVRLPVLPPE